MIYNSELRKLKAKKNVLITWTSAFELGSDSYPGLLLKLKWICSEGSCTYLLQVTVELLKIGNYL